MTRPGPDASTLLALYEFVAANQQFRQALVTSQAVGKDQVTSFSAVLSFTSFLFQNAHRTTRASLYAYLITFALTIISEDATTAKLICETSAPVRLCRQRPPYLPAVAKPNRPYVAAFVDICVDAMNHNLRKRLDVPFYRQNLAILSRLLGHLAKAHTKISYHWQELWRSLLSFVRFLTTYAEDMRLLPNALDLVNDVVDLLTLALTTGEAFLPDSSSYDDLFYKLVESGEALSSLRTAFHLAKADEQSPVNNLIGVSKHYQELIDEHHKGRGTTLSSSEVSKIIKMGYDTLPIAARDNADPVEKFREADWKTVLKKVARVAVTDAASLVG